MKPQNPAHTSQSGNVFFIILVGIVLFAALSFTISRGFRGETTNNLTAQEAALAAADILSYAQKLERAVNRLRRNGVSENDISFDQTFVTGYDTGSQPDANKVFSTTGGGVSWQSPPAGANDGSDWLFTGETCIADIGTGATGCDTDSTSNEELMAVLAVVGDTVCTEINDRLGITGIPVDSGGGASTAQFNGDFDDGTEIILGAGPYTAACFSFGGSNYFYAVLIER